MPTSLDSWTRTITHVSLDYRGAQSAVDEQCTPQAFEACGVLHPVPEDLRTGYAELIADRAWLIDRLAGRADYAMPYRQLVESRPKASARQGISAASYFLHLAAIEGAQRAQAQAAQRQREQEAYEAMLCVLCRTFEGACISREGHHLCGVCATEWDRQAAEAAAAKPIAGKRTRAQMVAELRG